MEATSVDFQANQIHVHDDEGEDAIVLHLFLAGNFQPITVRNLFFNSQSLELN